MKEKYFRQDSPFLVPTDDGKTIAEHFGLATTGSPEISIARMVAPPGWGEPFQTPEFDEYILMIRGRKQIEIDEEKIFLESGQSMKVFRGTRVRYSNPFAEEAEYWCVCIPAFSLDTVHREE